MNALEWSNNTEPSGDERWASEARASREVGGRYRISYLPGFKNWRGKIVGPFFEVHFRRSYGRKWRYLGLRDKLSGAIWEAENDHAERLLKREGAA
jgi:hypothetical protein